MRRIAVAVGLLFQSADEFCKTSAIAGMDGRQAAGVGCDFAQHVALSGHDRRKLEQEVRIRTNRRK
jgi:hypothetical protein